MNRLAGFAHSLLRIVSGYLFIHPGGMKLLGWFGGMPPGAELTPLLVTAGVIEIVCGTLIFLGLLTRPAAFLASGEMAFAYFIGHFPRGFWPIQNHGEPAVLFCFIFLYFAASGAGPISVDHLLGLDRRRNPLADEKPAAAS
ncbi:MAG TPA: DoxX family protein [Candidatus Eisenbacteria bacterium]|jgi:putative oxidoreductase|nr:DoxX family protein [Candidatus Eisenbacteria bacterium]